MSEIRLSSVLGPAFHLLARDVFQHGHTHYDLSGGRGSLKSSCVSLLVPLILLTNSNTHALVLRKVANTIRDSVYAQYLWAIGELGMAAYWDAKVQPMELIYKPTGQKIMFRGADDPMKIKSIKVPFGYIAVKKKISFPVGRRLEPFYNLPCAAGRSSGTLRATIHPSAGTTGPTKTAWKKERTGCAIRAHTWRPRRSGWGHSSWQKLNT